MRRHLDQKSPSLGLTLLYAAVFVEIGIAMPFMPVWLNAIGLDAAVIGALVALPIAVRILVTAPLMSLIDRGLRPRTILFAGSLAVAFTFALMPLAARDGGLPLALLVALNALAGAPLVPTIDYLTLAAVRAFPSVDYARVRLAGSVGFLAANLAGGAALGTFGERLAIPVLLAALASIAAVIAFAFAGNGRAPIRNDRTDIAPRLPPVLWFTICAAATIQASHAAVYAFGSITWSRQGVSGPLIGFLWAAGVAAEILFFALVGRLPAAWCSPFRLLALGATAAVIRSAGLAFAEGAIVTLTALQCLHALTFGATHYGAMLTVSRFAPDGARGRAQGTASAATALASASATLSCGWLYDDIGASGTFLMMVPLALAGLGFVVLAARSAPQPIMLWSP